MKLRTVLFFLFFIQYLTSVAQQYEYVPFPTENATWVVDIHSTVDCGPPPGWCETLTYLTSGDSLINDTNYTILKRFNGTSHLVQTLFREDALTRQIFIRGPGLGTEEHLAYDFGLNVGDSLYPPTTMGLSSQFYHTVSVIDTVELAGSLRRRFHLLDYGIWDVGSKWIEGLGGLNGPFLLYSQQESDQFLRCFYSHDNLYYFDPAPSWMPMEYPQYEFCDSAINGIWDSSSSSNVQLTVKPNPASNYVLVSCPTNFSGTLRMYSHVGLLVYENELHDEALINVLGLNSGIYVLQFISKDYQILTTKFIKP